LARSIAEVIGGAGIPRFERGDLALATSGARCAAAALMMAGVSAARVPAVLVALVALATLVALVFLVRLMALPRLNVLATVARLAVLDVPAALAWPVRLAWPGGIPGRASAIRPAGRTRAVIATKRATHCRDSIIPPSTRESSLALLLGPFVFKGVT
jgi:hypothetical protein